MYSAQTQMGGRIPISLHELNFFILQMGCLIFSHPFFNIQEAEQNRPGQYIASYYPFLF